MNEFKNYNPIVNFIYFAFVIGFSCLFMHPVCLAISFVSGFCYSVMLKGKKAIKYNLIYMIPMFFIMAMMNPIFNHEGVTIIAYLPGGNPLTLESIVYGVCAGAMVVSVICHFSCFNEIMTSDKLIALFGKIMPSLSLVISMTLRFVPKFKEQLKKVADAQRMLGNDVSSGGIIKRAKCGLNILSIMTTWSLESSIDTSDSMKSRGYGISQRTSYSVFTFDKRDGFALLTILILACYVLWGFIFGDVSFAFFPKIKYSLASAYKISVFSAYTILCFYPVLTQIGEVIKWKALSWKT